jgi:hypothetical protein
MSEIPEIPEIPEMPEISELNELNNKLNSSSETINMDNNLSRNEPYKNQEPKIFRYKFTKKFMRCIHVFSKQHQLEHQSDNLFEFKEEWKKWREENDNLIQDEIIRLRDQHFYGNILDKMFVSARYYYLKKYKNDKNDNKNKKIEKEKTRRKKYVGINKIYLKSMNKHILEHWFEDNYSPNSGFIDYCQKNVLLIFSYITEIVKKEKNLIDNIQEISKKIQSKIKKTYKNRYNTLHNLSFSEENNKYNKLMD